MMIKVYLNESVLNAIRTGNLEALKGNMPADIHLADEMHGQTMLDWAVSCRQETIVDYLLERGADVNFHHDKHAGRTTLELAKFMVKNAPVFSSEKTTSKQILDKLKAAVQPADRPRLGL